MISLNFTWIDNSIHLSTVSCGKVHVPGRARHKAWRELDSYNRIATVILIQNYKQKQELK